MAFASFDRKRAGLPMAEINMVPLIDVMLVLLVIFIVTAPLLTHAVRLELPQVNSKTLPPVTDPIAFAIDAQGQRWWNGERVTREEAVARFQREGHQAAPPEIHLRVDRSTPYQLVAETLADASSAGLSRLGFVSEPERP